ncbi:hypothetical protein [Streptococcus cuniculipharyngis]|uniref:Uncharacterized protein n=1 Tax=Streptococcus cuniculipharyngis TaxID=1562651 RepID=A0A5C5SAR9_9STRE|nr:hypothetical protein [Streptococcus cuniculipharyngis]TWS96472.1 hypothetical protein FRX57_07185 [Streptococcus cuniculipharyngis]
MARVFQLLVCQEKLPVKDVLNWLGQVGLQADDDRTYLAKLRVYHFLTALFIKLKEVDGLTKDEEDLYLGKLTSFPI